MHIWRPSPNPLDHLRAKFFHPLDLGRPISNESPPLQLSTNQLKENIIQGWLLYLLYIIRSFLQASFLFQYQIINLVWLSFDFFSFTWNLTICFFVEFCSCTLVLLCSFPQLSSKCLWLIIIHIFSTHFAINLFNLHDFKTYH